MLNATHATALVVGVLAVWRLTHLLWNEDGPGDIFVKLRRLARGDFAGRLLDCFYCLSLWVAAPFALLFARSLADWVLLWLGLSGGAILLERATAPADPPPPAAHWHEEPPPANPQEEEREDVLLR